MHFTLFSTLTTGHYLLNLSWAWPRPKKWAGRWKYDYWKWRETYLSFFSFLGGFVYLFTYDTYDSMILYLHLLLSLETWFGFTFIPCRYFWNICVSIFVYLSSGDSQFCNFCWSRRFLRRPLSFCDGFLSKAWLSFFFIYLYLTLLLIIMVAYLWDC